MLTGPARSPHRFIASIAVAIALLAFARPARAEADASAVATIIAINRKALDDYDNLNFDEARSGLKAALALCDRKGLGSHPVRAQTYLNLGVVLLAADAKHRGVAVAQFRRALQIQADVRPAKRIANPEVQQAFDEARAEIEIEATSINQRSHAPPAGRAPPAAAGDVVAGHGSGDAGGDDGDARGVARRRAARWHLAFGVGSGVGWASGTGEVNTDVTIPSGFQPSSRVHLAPELGYFVRPDLLLSLQGRFQLISGATAERDPTQTTCGSDHVCSASTGASAVFVKASWFFGHGEGRLRPYVMGALGYGQIRHVVSLPAHMDCGADPAHPVSCVDTAAAGPIFVGPGAGVMLEIAPHFALTLGASTLVGFSAFTFHVDVSGGVAVDL
jgi:hypothetical protein